MKLVHGTKNVMISNAPRLVLFGSSNRERERILLDCILSNERANEKVKTWTARNWSHTILCCVDVSVSVVTGFSYLLLSGVFLLLILLLYQWMCMLRVVFGFSANFIQMFFLSFFFVLLFNGYLVTLWLVFMHFTKQAENCSAYGANRFMRVQQTLPSVNVLNCVNIQCAWFVSTEQNFTKNEFVCAIPRWMDGCCFHNKVQCHRYPSICMLAYRLIAV